MVDQTIVTAAKTYVGSLSKELQCKDAYLFGSCAKGSQRKDSDIDVAVIFDNISDFLGMQLKLMRLRRNIDLRIEPHPFLSSEFTAENPFAKEILRTGIRIT